MQHDATEQHQETRRSGSASPPRRHAVTAGQPRCPCPPWCCTDHDRPHADGEIIRTHMGRKAAVTLGRASLLRQAVPDQIGVRPVHAAQHGQRPGIQLDGWRYRSDTPGPWLAIPLSDAAALDDVIGILAAATPRQHRELAEAIRAAAAAIAEDRGERS
jgi:hypothetical protein